MPGPSYQFGSFVVDRLRYRATRDGIALDLTPKLLDLLLHLLDHAGELVTKEQLLDALWPDANVTDNALAQAVSELRDALGDHPAQPEFIKTVARRGYRFVAPVKPIESTPHHPEVLPVAVSDDRTIAVMDFANVTGDPNSGWLAAGIAETVTGDLRKSGRFRVVDRVRVIDAIRRTGGSVQEVAARVGATFAVVGSYQTATDRVRITGRIVNVATGEAVADAKVDGPVASIFDLQDQVVAQLLAELGVAETAVPRGARRETPSLEAYRAYSEGWLRLETLDLREIPQAIVDFQHAISIDPGYAHAFTGLATAQVVRYETTRSDTAPEADVLAAAISYARRAVTLEADLAEAHAALAFALVSAGQSVEAVGEARRAVALEPTNWRHFFRLAYAAWGDERIRAAIQTLALYPDFAFAYFQMAMVHVARGHLREAETVLRQGAVVQDRQIARGDRFPALGLHWLFGLVRLAQNDIDEALQEFEREARLADPHRLYGREYAMSAVQARGACLLRLDRHADAIDCFEHALALYPEHAPSYIGIVRAQRARGSSDGSALKTLEAILPVLSRSRPIEAALVEAQMLVAMGRLTESAGVLGSLLANAPPGFAGWTIPIEPFLHELHGTEGFSADLRGLALRAR